MDSVLLLPVVKENKEALRSSWEKGTQVASYGLAGLRVTSEAEEPELREEGEPGKRLRDGPLGVISLFM